MCLAQACFGQPPEPRWGKDVFLGTRHTSRLIKNGNKPPVSRAEAQRWLDIANSAHNSLPNEASFSARAADGARLEFSGVWRVIEHDRKTERVKLCLLVPHRRTTPRRPSRSTTASRSTAPTSDQYDEELSPLNLLHDLRWTR
jgi:hypothetical protein